LVAVAIVAVVLWQVLAQNIQPSKIAVPGVTVDFAKATEKVPTATREFIVGRWMVRQQMPDGSAGESFITYEEDGTFSGDQEWVGAFAGTKATARGEWEVQILGKTRFGLMLYFENGRQSGGTFNIIDNNRIQNTDVNYIANRL
jgi:hypothetical protein